MFEDRGHPQRVLAGLNRLRLDGALLCDVVLCCEGQEFPCHRYVLASFSTHFEAMFTAATRESTPERVSIGGVEPQLIAVLVKFGYTSKVSISTENVQALLAASSMLDVTAVGNACRDFMKRRMDEAEMFEDSGHPQRVLEGLNRLRRTPGSRHTSGIEEGVPEADEVVQGVKAGGGRRQLIRSAALRSPFSSANTQKRDQRPKGRPEDVERALLCDVILCCEEQEFPCHRYVLASFCSYFEAMFTSGMKESTQDRVSLSGVEPQIVEMLVNYAYTSELSISTEHVQALLAAANLWDIVAVGNACGDFMKPHIDRKNCVEMFCFSEDHSCDTLKKHSMDYMLEHFSVLYQQPEFLSLSVERLTEIISSDHLSVPKEDMVFEAAKMWLDECPDTRRESFEKVLEKIRLPLISPSYLPTVVEGLDLVKEHEGCQRFISEAKKERPYRHTARRRRPTVIVTVGAKCNKAGFHKVESLDPLKIARSRRTLGYLPFKARQYAVVASGSTLYVAGGRRDGSASKETWRYDVHHKSWLKMAPMKMARYGFSLVELDGCVLAVGGSGSEESKGSIECYDPQNNTWKLLEAAVPKAYHANAHVSSPLVVARGRWLYFIGRDPVQVSRYNPATSVWEKVTPFGSPPMLNYPSAACVLNEKIYVTGWSPTLESFPDSLDHGCRMACFNPETNRWTMCDQLHGQGHRLRYRLSLAVVDGKIYALGGLDDDERHVESMARYCEETNRWQSMESGDGGEFHCVTLRLRKDHVPVADDDDDESSDDSSDDEDSNVSDTDNYGYYVDSDSEFDDREEYRYSSPYRYMK